MANWCIRAIAPGLLMFASTDVWDLKARVQKAVTTRRRKAEEADELERQRKMKYTSKVYRSA